jgi:hypothetical protein
MTVLVSILERSIARDEELGSIKELRNDVDFLSGVRRGLEARRRGDRLHWNDVKAELEIEQD